MKYIRTNVNVIRQLVTSIYKKLTHCDQLSIVQLKKNFVIANNNKILISASVLIVVIPPASIFSGIIMDNLGRLNCIKIAGIPGVIGWSMIALANNVTTIILGRLLVGVSSAWGTSPGIVYITEIASSNLRMSLMAIAPAYVSLGWF